MEFKYYKAMKDMETFRLLWCYNYFLYGGGGGINV